MKSRNENGMVTAELAISALLGTLVVGAIIWCVAAGFLQLRASEVAAQTALLEARGDAEEVGKIKHRNADLSITISRIDGRAKVVVAATSRAFGKLPGLPLTAQALCPMEPGQS